MFKNRFMAKESLCEFDRLCLDLVDAFAEGRCSVRFGTRNRQSNFAIPESEKIYNTVSVK
jgi:hypothetical protein